MTNKYEFSVAKKYLSESSTVLEVGAGKAAFAKFVASGKYTGLEFNDKAIESARLSGITLIKQSAEQHAACGHKYDAVVSFQVLEHVADPAGFICSCMRCLKPGGFLIFAVPATDGFSGLALNHILDLPPHHVTRWSGVVLKSIEKLFGIKILDIEYEPVAGYHKWFASKTIREYQIRSFFRFKKQLIDFSFTAQMISLLASFFGRVFPVDERLLKRSHCCGCL